MYNVGDSESPLGQMEEWQKAADKKKMPQSNQGEKKDCKGLSRSMFKPRIANFSWNHNGAPGYREHFP